MSILGFLGLAEFGLVPDLSTCFCLPSPFISVSDPVSVSSSLILCLVFPLVSGSSFYAYKMFSVIPLITVDRFPTLTPCRSLTPRLWGRDSLSPTPAFNENKNPGCFLVWPGHLGQGRQALKSLESCPPPPWWGLVDMLNPQFLGTKSLSYSLEIYQLWNLWWIPCPYSQR